MQPEVIYAHARNFLFLTNLLKVPLNVDIYRRNVRVLHEVGVDESVSGDNFATGNKINVLIAHAQTLSSQKSLNGVARPK